MNLTIRLQILKDAGQLSENNYQIIQQIIGLFKTKWNLNLTEENGAMFITHLVVAFARIDKEEDLLGLDKGIIQELEGSKCFSQSAQVLQDIEDALSKEISDSEKGYILVHLCTLFAKGES